MLYKNYMPDKTKLFIRWDVMMAYIISDEAFKLTTKCPSNIPCLSSNKNPMCSEERPVCSVEIPPESMIFIRNKTNNAYNKWYTYFLKNTKVIIYACVPAEWRIHDEQ